jgi:hypothetical protein
MTYIVGAVIVVWLVAGVALWTLADSAGYADSMKGWK